MKKYFQNKNFLVGFSLVLFVFLIMLVGFFYMPYNPEKTDTANKLLSFSKNHLLGTDHLGRDVLSRIMEGSRISFLIGFTVMILGFIFGTIIGALSGYFGGIIDSIVMKIIDAQMAFPGILLALMLIAVFGASIENTVLALTIISVPRYARISRSGFIKCKSSLFVMSAKSHGATNARIIIHHILPNIASDLIITSSLTFAFAILNEAGLSYLGLGVQPPKASFGNILSDAQRYILQSPEGILIPAIILTMLVLGFNLIGDGISEVNEH